VNTKSRKACLPAALLILAAVRVLSAQAPSRTLFKDLPPTDPRREVVQAVLASPLDALRARFAGREWVEGGYRDAWDRARRYFPWSVYYVEPGTYFMTHGFGPDGRLFMEIHDSAYLSLSVANRRTFTDGAIVIEYRRMLGAAGGGEAAAFREKMGRLEPYFRDEATKKRFRKTLGEALYRRLLEGLREENAHMLAGGLMHEGMHAGMDGEQLVVRIQAEFKAGGLAVQWDELRAFMAEAAFHEAFCRWAKDDIVAGWSEVEARLEDLEILRRRPRLDRAKDRERFERATARAGATSAVIRLRMRELWQSAQRLQGLLVSFQKDYLRPNPPDGIEDRMKKLAGDIAAFVDEAGEGIRRTELALRRLEEVLGQWDEWAAGPRPFPPPVTDSKDILTRAGKVAWPAPPATAVDRLKKRAEEEIAKERAASAGGRQGPTFSRRPDSGPAS
jgi:hypothetical protein